jgi:uncharacterized repeat protein (TIGR01451 family)
LQFIQPGETATFTLMVSNNGTVNALAVIVTDALPDPLVFVSATTTQGTFTVNGNTVTFNIGTVAPGQTVTLKIVARARTDVKTPIDTTNIATLNSSGGTRSASAALRITRISLPATGEHPNEIPLALWLLVALAGGMGLAIAVIRIQRKRAH